MNEPATLTEAAVLGAMDEAVQQWGERHRHDRNTTAHFTPTDGTCIIGATLQYLLPARVMNWLVAHHNESDVGRVLADPDCPFKLETEALYEALEEAQLQQDQGAPWGTVRDWFKHNLEALTTVGDG